MSAADAPPEPSRSTDPDGELVASGEQSAWSVLGTPPPHEGVAASIDPSATVLDFEDVGPTRINAPNPLSERPVSDGEDGLGLALGQTVGHYRLERRLGQGASSAVYEATHVVVGRRVALKCLFPHAAAQSVQVQRLFREAKISARVAHDNVIQIFDGGRDGDVYFLAMELLEGRPLSALIEEGPRPLTETIELIRQVMGGVAALHDAGVIHRDLKPENIFLQARPDDPLHPGVAKLLDFGVSKMSEHASGSKLTAAGVVMGTPYYMAPEQVADTSAVDQRADVFSIGVILYEVLTGELPYDGDNIVEIFTQALDGRPVPVRQLRPEVPPSLEAVIACAMCPDKEGRFETVRAMRAALDAVRLGVVEAPEQWADVSEPWMLACDHGAARNDSPLPLELEPTRAMAPAPVPSDPLPSPGRQVPATASPKRSNVPVWMLMVAGAALGALVALAGVVLLYALFS